MTHIAKFGFQDSCGSGESVTIPILQKSEQEKWPVLLWFYMKTLGLYHSGKENVRFIFIVTIKNKVKLV